MVQKPCPFDQKDFGSYGLIVFLNLKGNDISFFTWTILLVLGQYNILGH
uniref:Uncharacterized protein n=1 Tax=Anguilla anguilla TaxID=7936 RepID=A0A0E9WDS7_ANGAN